MKRPESYFPDLSGVTPEEIAILDVKRAESEGISHPLHLPFRKDGGSGLGVLLIHGFGASPFEMLPLGDYLHRRGHSVYGVRLVGHGTDVRNLHVLTWKDWYAGLLYGYWYLRNTCRQVAVVGLSTGALLGLRLSVYNPVLMTGLLSPAFGIKSPLFRLTPFLRHFLKTIPHNTLDESMKEHYYNPRSVSGVYQLYLLQKEIRRILPQMTVPVVGYQSVRDDVVSLKCTTKAFQHMDGNMTFLTDDDTAQHVLTLSKGNETIFSGLTESIEERFRYVEE